MRFRETANLSLILVAVISLYVHAAEEAKITIKVLGRDGQPAPGVLLGTFGQRSDSRQGFCVGFCGPFAATVTTGTNGSATVARFDEPLKHDRPYVFPARGFESVICAMTKDQSLTALKRVTEVDTLKVIELKLETACQVSGVAAMPAEFQGSFIAGTSVNFAEKERTVGNNFFNLSSRDHAFAFPLPAGTFAIASSGQYEQNGHTRSSDIVTKYVSIQPGQHEVKLKFDLPLSWQQLYLFDRPAPELRDIRGWKNGGPVKLADLRGKVVVLHFWGYRCAPCVGEMPEMMTLYDRYKDKDFAFISVHDATVNSVEEMDQKLEKFREKTWKGRDLPFITAIDGGGNTNIEHSDRTAPGATFAAYGWSRFGPAVVIDRKGNVVGCADNAGDLEQFLRKEFADATRSNARK